MREFVQTPLGHSGVFTTGKLLLSQPRKLAVDDDDDDDDDDDGDDDDDDDDDDAFVSGFFIFIFCGVSSGTSILLIISYLILWNYFYYVFWNQFSNSKTEKLISIIINNIS